MNNGNQKQHATERWRRHWKAWKESGLSQEQYGRQHQLKIHAFRYWVTKFNQPINQSTTALVKLPVQAQPLRESLLELVIQEKYRLMIRSGFDPRLLQEVLRSLEGGACS
jgi:hypothetical protein